MDWSDASSSDARTNKLPGHILVVDDSDHIVFLLNQILASDGHRVTTARNGREALQRLAEKVPDLIVLDLDMPEIDGFEVCRRVKENPATRLLPVLILTGRDLFDSRMRAWNLGADEFLSKPFHALELTARCRSLLRVKRLVDELDSAQAVMFALARTVEAKSHYTHGHSDRVAQYALTLADTLGLPEADRELLRRGALLHDIGKISTPDAILNKPGKLTAEEYEIIQAHPAQGAHIVEPLRSIREIVPLIRWHHERLDGRGYPDGLLGGAIPLLVRILSVADCYDAMASERPYRPALTHAECLAALRANADGGGLDPLLVERFCVTVSGSLGTPVPLTAVEHA